MRALVVTIAHHPEDARILHRQIAALADAGHAVTYAAPWSATGAVPPPHLTALDLPRAAGRTRLHAIRAARRLIARHAHEHDVVLVHDPELLLALPGTRRPPTVWDVHEDLAAALGDKAWVPAVLRRPLGAVVRLTERLAEQRVHLLLAEDGYRDRFRGDHPVVPNEPVVPEVVPPPGTERAVYLGRLSVGRGALDLCALAERLPEGVGIDVYGWAEPDVDPALRAASGSGLRWHGRTPNDAALGALDGALCGLSLLHDLPNYRHSRPTKIVEYMAHGIPVITTPLPEARALVERHRCGIVVGFEALDEVDEALTRLASDADLRCELGANGHRAARDDYNWSISGRAFVEQLERWSAGGSSVN